MVDKPKTLTVACKVPNGIVIQANEQYSYNEPVMGGGTREVKAFRPTGLAITLKGPRRPDLTKDQETLPPGGYGLTFNVPADIWENWLASNKDTPMVKNGMIFAHAGGSTESARDFAKDHAKTQSGLEPLLQDGDPRRPRPASKNLSQVGKADMGDPT